MTTATEGLARGDWVGSDPQVQAPPKRPDEPEWHHLRLFGRGRQAFRFAAGVETHDEL